MRTITKVYDSHTQARDAVTALETAGIASSQISLLANKSVSAKYDDVDEASSTVTGAGLGAAVGGGAGLLAGLGLLAIPGVGPIVAAGWLAATAAGAIAGGAAGGIVGALVDSGVPEDHAHVYSEAVRRGGTLVSVKTDDAQAARVSSILESHQPVDPDRLGAKYRESGWREFDPAAAPYEVSKVEREGMRR